MISIIRGAGREFKGRALATLIFERSRTGTVCLASTSWLLLSGICTGTSYKYCFDLYIIYRPNTRNKCSNPREPYELNWEAIV
jgi:hypothetical protein